jgi:SAM-dependent methyltransferase
LKPEFEYDWVVLHKGLVDTLPPVFVVQSCASLTPVFANEVFVILKRGTAEHKLDLENPHVIALTNRLTTVAMNGGDSLQPSDPVLPDPGAIVKFSELAPETIANAMDEFWLHGGYIYATHRDQIYYNEIDRYIREFIGNCGGQFVLDLACGRGRCADILAQATRVMGIDISGVAINMAQQSHRDKPNFFFDRMDAHNLSFPTHSFDIVLFIDAIEHVLDADRVFTEITRVLKPGGVVLATVANRDSLNQILTRKLGYTEFLTNYQHIREFSFCETLSLLDRHGLVLERQAGIFLYPYWGVPGIDGVVRKVTDDDPEFVELTRRLGELVGAAHAYCSVVLARKQS